MKSKYQNVDYSETHIEYYPIEENGKNVVILEISAAKEKPVTFDGSAYIRIGESTSSLSKYPDMERKIWNNDKNKNFEK